MAIANHLIYVVLSVAFTVFVGQSLYFNGRPFLIECWGTARIADAVNRLLLVGFYLMNSAFVLIILRFGETGSTIERSLELIAGRVGFVALVMGAMHVNNLFLCDLARRKREQKQIAPSN